MCATRHQEMCATCGEGSLQYGTVGHLIGVGVGLGLKNMALLSLSISLAFAHSLMFSFSTLKCLFVEFRIFKTKVIVQVLKIMDEKHPERA